MEEIDADVGAGDTADVDDEASGSSGRIAACRTSPERTVFTERDNADGWIATDLTVELKR